MWQSLLENKNDKRYQYTLKEIMQQPECWLKTAKIILEDRDLEKFLAVALSDIHRPIIVSGAGSSEFAGKAVLDTLSTHIKRRVILAPTTEIVTNPKKYNIPNEPALMISFARSGNSPESVASVQLIKQVAPSTKHLIITCNKEGKLAKGAKSNNNTYCVLLPEETNDESLVMTSSFSSMLLAVALCGMFDQKETLMPILEKTCANTRAIFTTIPDRLNRIVSSPQVHRIQYLGTSDAIGLLTEGHLKMLEMTDGQVATRVDSYLGLRHGPQVFVDKNTVVVALLSTDPYVRQYEIDLLKEMKSKNQGYAYIVIGSNTHEVDLPNLVACELEPSDEFFKLLPAVVVVQLLGFFKCLALGLSPDSPSSSGVINRVVQGVTIYSFKD